MSAYLTFTRKKTLDVTELKVYWDKIRATFAGHRVKVLVNSWNGGATSPPGSRRCTPRRFATASPRCADPGKLTCRIRI